LGGDQSEWAPQAVAKKIGNMIDEEIHYASGRASTSTAPALICAKYFAVPAEEAALGAEASNLVLCSCCLLSVQNLHIGIRKASV
jgi:hypothetical protein